MLLENLIQKDGRFITEDKALFLNLPNIYSGNIQKDTIDNNYFRKVLFTGMHSQLVVMSINPQEDIGNEIHKVDQFFRIEQGMAKFILNDIEEVFLTKDDAITVPANTFHNVINAGDKELKLYTIYSPPNHPPGTVHETKAVAMKEGD